MRGWGDAVRKPSASRQGIAGDQVAWGRARKGGGFGTQDESRDLVMLLGPRRDIIPAKAVVHREVGPNAEAVLDEEVAIGGTLVKSR